MITVSFAPNLMTAAELSFAIVALSEQVNTAATQKALVALVGKDEAAALIDKARQAFNNFES